MIFFERILKEVPEGILSNTEEDIPEETDQDILIGPVPGFDSIPGLLLAFSGHPQALLSHLLLCMLCVLSLPTGKAT